MLFSTPQRKKLFMNVYGGGGQINLWITYRRHHKKKLMRFKFTCKKYFQSFPLCYYDKDSPELFKGESCLGRKSRWEGDDEEEDREINQKWADFLYQTHFSLEIGN